MNDETTGLSIKLFGGLKPKIYPYLVNDGSKHKKAKGMNRNFVEKVTHNKYIWRCFLKSKCSRHSMNRIQNKNHRIGTYEINKTYLSCFDEKIYIQNNFYYGLTLGYQNCF